MSKLVRSVSLLKANESNKEWLNEISNLNRKTGDSCIKVVDSKENGQEQDELKENVYFVVI